MDGKRPELRLIKSDLSQQKKLEIENKFNTLIVQSLCFGKYEEYSKLIQGYKEYSQTKDILILLNCIKEFDWLTGLGAPSLERVDLIKSSLGKIKSTLLELENISESNSQDLIRESARLLIKSIIKNDKKTIALVMFAINNFKVSKNFEKFRSQLLELND